MHTFLYGGGLNPPTPPLWLRHCVHSTITIFELLLPFDHRMMLWKFCDDICNGSEVIALRHILKQTDTIENTLAVWQLPW